MRCGWRDRCAQAGCEIRTDGRGLCEILGTSAMLSDLGRAAGRAVPLGPGLVRTVADTFGQVAVSSEAMRAAASAAAEDPRERWARTGEIRTESNSPPAQWVRPGRTAQGGEAPLAVMREKRNAESRSGRMPDSLTTCRHASRAGGRR